MEDINMENVEYYEDLMEMFEKNNGFIRPRYIPIEDAEKAKKLNRKTIEINGQKLYRVGYFVALMYNGVFRIGVSRCSDSDQFDKKFGKWLAIKRAVSPRWSAITLVEKMCKEPDFNEFQAFSKESVKRVMFPTIKHMKDEDLTPEALSFIKEYESK